MVGSLRDRKPDLGGRAHFCARPPRLLTEWSMEEPGQWGETHLVLADAEDLIPSREPRDPSL